MSYTEGRQLVNAALEQFNSDAAINTLLKKLHPSTKTVLEWLAYNEERLIDNEYEYISTPTLCTYKPYDNS